MSPRQFIRHNSSINNDNNIIHLNCIKMLTLSLLFSIFFIIFILMSVYWIIVFLKRINCFRKYQRGIAKQITNVESVYINEQYYYHYETHIRVLVYLILMNLVEVSIGCNFFVARVLDYYYRSTGKYMLFINVLEQCINVNNDTVLENQIIDYYIPYLNILGSISHILFLYFAVIAINLMNYLIKRNLKVPKLNCLVNCRALLTMASIIGVFDLASAYFTTFVSLNIIIRLSSLFPYYIIFVKTANQFKSTLFKTAIQRLAQHGSNREELKQYKYFKYTINIICLGGIIALIAQLLQSISTCLTNIIFFENCFFPFNIYNLFQDRIQSDELMKYLVVVFTLGEVTNFVGSICNSSIYINHQ